VDVVQPRLCLPSSTSVSPDMTLPDSSHSCNMPKPSQSSVEFYTLPILATCPNQVSLLLNSILFPFLQHAQTKWSSVEFYTLPILATCQNQVSLLLNSILFPFLQHAQTKSVFCWILYVLALAAVILPHSQSIFCLFWKFHIFFSTSKTISKCVLCNFVLI